MSAPTFAGGRVDTTPGAPLEPLNELHSSKGWQLVATQWHVDPKTGRKGTTPLSGTTGSRVPFLTGDQMLPKIRGKTLHLEGGPECTGRNAKPANRPPLRVVGFDVDDGYSGKSGGDTLVNAEMRLGPLPGSWSLTARGPYQPSRRIWYRIPPDLILRDEFFTEFGGCIEIIRTGHRYSWAWPAIHTKGGRIVGPVLWYGPDGEVDELPHVDNLPELPAAWTERGREQMAARAERERQGGPIGAGTAITARYADAVIAKQVRKFMGPPDLRGGDFRNALFGLATSITRRSLARGHGEAQVWEEIRELFAEHPWRKTPNDRDVRWIEDGIRAGRAQPWVIEPEVSNADGSLTEEDIAGIWATYPPGCNAGDAAFRDDVLSWGGRQISEQTEVEDATPARQQAATDAELEAFLTRCTRYRDPARLGRRTAWMRPDVARPRRMHQHAKALVEDAIAGHYPAEKAVMALVDAYRRSGCTDPAVPRRVLAAALDAVLTSKVSAAR